MNDNVKIAESLTICGVKACSISGNIPGAEIVKNGERCGAGPVDFKVGDRIGFYIPPAAAAGSFRVEAARRPWWRRVDWFYPVAAVVLAILIVIIGIGYISPRPVITFEASGAWPAARP